MSTQCPNCKVAVSATAKFCQDCGTELIDQSADRITGVQRRPAFLTQQPEIPSSVRKKMEAAHENLSGARRLVTVMFADVQGFTSLCEKLDPEQVTDLMNKYLGRLGEVVYEFEGYVDKFMGDCIMALFGAPIAHENDPELAIRSALKMLSELQTLNQQHTLNLGIRIGINSGMVVAGGVGTNLKLDFTVMGDAVNVAQRLQTAADPNTIVVGKTVARAAQSVFEFTALEQKKLKGKSELVEAFQVKGFRRRAVDARGVRDANLKLIGRSVEIQILSKAIEELKNHRPKAFVIRASAGMGKSRLKLEFKNQVEQAKIKWFEFKGNPLKTQVAYGVMKTVAQKLLSSAIRVDSKSKRPILSTLDSLGLDEIHHLFLELFLDLSPLDVGRPKIEPHQLKRSTFSAMRALIEESARREPMVLFIDDLQSIDLGSLEMLEYLSAASNDCLMAGAVRSDDYNLSQKFKIIDLNPLEADEVLTLAKSLLKTENLPSAVAQILTTKSQGVPLFVEELLKALMESGQLVQRETGWEFVKSDRELTLPDSIQSLILARIDRLYPSDRKVLEYCSVLGRQFSDRFLREVVGNQAPLQESLQFLRRREFIFETAVNERETEYIFNHPLTQQVVYQSILIKNRKEMHREVAVALENSIGNTKDSIEESLLQQLAFHFATSGDETRGFSYFQMAVDQRRKQYSFESALALQNWGEPYFKSKRLEILESKAEVLGDLGEFDRAINIWAELQTSTDIAKQVKACISLSDIYRRQHQLEAARKYLEVGEASRVQVKSVDLDFEYEKSWANLLRGEKKYSEALERLERTLNLATQMNNTLKVAETLNDLGALFLNLHDVKAAETSFSKAFQLAKELREPSIFIPVVMNLGSIFYMRQEFQEAVKYFDRAEKMSQAISDPLSRLFALHNLGLAHTKLNAMDAAENCFRNALNLSIKLTLPKHRWANELHLAFISLKTKGRQVGEPKLKQLIREFAEAGEWVIFGEGVSLLSHYLKDFGETQSAIQEIEAALNTLSTTNEDAIKLRLQLDLKRITKQE